MEMNKVPTLLRGLAAEARKCNTFAEFRDDFLHQIKHGRYYHVTTDPNFIIDPSKGPRDMSSMAEGRAEAGKLMVTSDLENWTDHYEGARQYVAIIDMSDVPRKAYWQSQRGFGNEFYVNDPAKARVIGVVSVAQAKADARKHHAALPDSDEKLEKFYNFVKSKTAAGGKHRVPVDDLPQATKTDLIANIAEHLQTLGVVMSNDQPVDTYDVQVNLFDLMEPPAVTLYDAPVEALYKTMNRGNSEAAVSRYVEMLKSPGFEFDPIFVVEGKFYDGGHRLEAYHRAHRQTIPVVDITPFIKASKETWDNWLLGDEHTKFAAPAERTAPVYFYIEVPREARSHFWEEPPEGNLEFWAFKQRPRCFYNQKIVFTFDRQPVAEARVLRIEDPGNSKCEQTGKYEKHHKVFWNPREFKKYKTASNDDYHMIEGCGIYAVDLAKKLGGSVYVLSAQGGEPWSEEIPYEVTHAYAEKDGKTFDVRGERPVEEMARELNISGYNLKGPWSPEEFEAKFMGSSDDKPLYGKTAAAAKWRYEDDDDRLSADPENLRVLPMGQIEESDIADGRWILLANGRWAGIPHSDDQVEHGDVPPLLGSASKGYIRVTSDLGFRIYTTPTDQQLGEIGRVTKGRRIYWDLDDPNSEEFGEDGITGEGNIGTFRRAVEQVYFSKKAGAELPEKPEPEPWEMKRDEYAPRPPITKDEKGNPIYEDETDEQFRNRQDRSREWEQKSLAAMSLGRMTPQQAKERGYWIDVDKPESFKPLPPKLYHVTTHASGVYSGGLKSRYELLMREGGTGLGGGSDKSISFTTDLLTASGIYKAIMEAIHVLTGKLTVQQMIQMAEKGDGAQRPWISELINWGGSNFVSYSEKDPNRWQPGKPYPLHHAAFFEGRKIENMGLGVTLEEATQKFPNAEPVGEGWTGGDGVQRYSTFKVPLTPEQVRETNFDFFKTWLATRENAGGALNPLFFSSNIKVLASTPEDEVAILEFKPVPGAMGTQESALGEWRTYSGAAVQLVGDVPPNIKVAALDNSPAYILRQAKFYADTFEVGHPARVIPESLDWEAMDRFELENLEGFHQGNYNWAMDDVSDYDEDYRQKMQDALLDGKIEPIIIAQGTDGKFYLWDGNHRVGLAQQLNVDVIPAYVGFQKEGAVKKAAARSVWFHGTSLKNTNAILKEGLIAYPKNRVWDKDDSSLLSPSKESLGGVYFTTNLMTAISAVKDKKEGGGLTVVCAELQPNTMFLDEDDVTFVVQHPLGSNLSDNSFYVLAYYLAATHERVPDNWKADVKDKQDKFADSCISQWKFRLGGSAGKPDGKKMHPDLEKRLRDMLPQIWIAALGRLAGHTAQRHQTDNYELMRAYAEVFGREGYDYDQIQNAVRSFFPTAQRGEEHYRKALEPLTRTLRVLIGVEHFNPTARIVENIGYRGSNHIVAVVQIANPKALSSSVADPYQMKVLYGTLPPEFVTQWKERMGGHHKVVTSAEADHEIPNPLTVTPTRPDVIEDWKYLPERDREQMIAEAELREVSPSDLKTNQATVSQKDLDIYLDDPTKINSELTEPCGGDHQKHPLVLDTNEGMYVFDGNHRCAAALLKQLMVKVLYIDLRPLQGPQGKIGAALPSFEQAIDKKTDTNNEFNLEIDIWKDYNLRNMRDQYDEAVAKLGALKFPLTVYRCFALKEGGKIDYSNLGGSWSLNSRAAYLTVHEMFSDEDGYEYQTIEGTIQSSTAVDWLNTVRAWMTLPDEEEIRLKPGAKVKVRGKTHSAEAKKKKIVKKPTTKLLKPQYDTGEEEDYPLDAFDTDFGGWILADGTEHGITETEAGYEGHTTTARRIGFSGTGQALDSGAVRVDLNRGEGGVLFEVLRLDDNTRRILKDAMFRSHPPISIESWNPTRTWTTFKSRDEALDWLDHRTVFASKSGGAYTAYVLTDASRTALLEKFPPKFPDVIAHHVTIDFGVPEDTAAPEAARIEAVGYAADESLEAIVVSVNGETKRPDGNVYHVTLSLDRSQKRKPADSKQLVAKGYEAVAPFELHTTAQTIPTEKQAVKAAAEVQTPSADYKFPLTIWRSLRIRKGEAIDYNKVGVHWTDWESNMDLFRNSGGLWDKEGENADEQSFDYIVLQAQVTKPEHVDWEATIRQNEQEPMEHEITIKPGAKLRLVSINGKRVKQQIIASKTADAYNEEGYWAGEGNAASGILPVCPKTGRVGVILRSSEVDYPNTYSTIGGAVKRGLSPSQNAKVELQEETGYKGGINLIPAYVFSSGGFKYHNFIGVVTKEFGLHPMSGESAGIEFSDENTSLTWVTWDELMEDIKTNASDYHPEFLKFLRHSGSQIEQALGKKKAATKDPGLDAFMRDLWAQTYANPFNNRERIWAASGPDADKVAISANVFNNRIHLSLIRSLEPGERMGYGSAGLKFFCTLADKHNVEIELDADPPVGNKVLSRSQLISWYKRHGFIEGETNDPGYLIRRPQGKLKLGPKMKKIPLDKK